MNFLRTLINKMVVVFVALILVVSSVNADSRLEVGDWDIDDDGRADALTDGLLFLRYAFELRGDALISGLISSNSEYTTASDIERELALVYDASGDIDGDGNVDALTDGLLLLRYLFGLSGETLTVGVVANGATRTSSSDLEGFIGNLMPSAPYITLLGSAVLDHEQATDYVDAGATAMDYADGSVAVSVSGSVNSGVAGVYVLTYTAVDSEGNTAKPLTRTVTVADTTAPVITLLGESTVEVDQNASYTDAGATATDAVDGSVEVVTSGSVDTNTAGVYTLNYSATDSSGNVATSSREVTVKEGIVTFIVTADYNGGWLYIIDGVVKPELTLEIGTTYTFKYPSNHPLRFSITSDGIHNGGSEYTQGVDTSVNGQITISITSSTVNTLYYYCRLHVNQGGKINVE